MKKPGTMAGLEVWDVESSMPVVLALAGRRAGC